MDCTGKDGGTSGRLDSWQPNNQGEMTAISHDDHGRHAAAAGGGTLATVSIEAAVPHRHARLPSAAI